MPRRPAELPVERKQAERIAERVVENANVHALLCACPDRFPERVADRISPEDVILEQYLPLSIFDERQHRRTRISTVPQELYAIRTREGLRRDFGEPGLKPRIEWADRVQTPRRVNHREGISCAPLAGVLVTRAAHLTALLQQRPDPAVTRDDARHSTMILPRNMPI